MSLIKIVFWDVGGVLLTNGWDHAAREEAARVFRVDAEKLQARHRSIVEEFECGRLSLDQYLARTVFDEPRTFSLEAFVQFMYSQSRAHDDRLMMLEHIRQVGGRLMVMLNNESLELNRYRIERFGLGRYFDVFFSSCFLGLRKPDERIYRLVLDLLQATPDACLFIDDRTVNLAAAGQMGIHTIRCQDSRQLKEELSHFEIVV